MPHDLNSYRFCPIAWYLLNPRHYLLYIHLAKEKNLYENVDEKEKYLDAEMLKKTFYLGNKFVKSCPQSRETIPLAIGFF